ncbi:MULTISPECIES: DJ-1/PfpI family protein [unclassified Microbacterium]|uniref:DJ-1/PfpI family protein n=1 Tax=unclassified Microbacterium TaxID=2609290 RepID=UPI0030163898
MGRPFRIVCIVFPRMTQLDLTGPAQVFARFPGTEVEFAWHRVEPVPTDAGFSILPTADFGAAGRADVLFVPGGPGAFDLFEDDAALAFVREQASRAHLVTSVCTGAFVLGAAGLLAGRRATTHWASLELLAGFGAIPTPERVVRDGNLITGAGVSSGIDFALTLAAELYGAGIARSIQLGIEYDPAPPFDAGSPACPDADQGEVARLRERMAQARGPLVRAAAARLGRPAGGAPAG